MPEKRSELPAFDSGITLEPGGQLFLDERLELEMQALSRRFREIRGVALAECFDIEYNLDRVICEHFFPEPQQELKEGEKPRATSPLRIEFDLLFLKKQSTFNTKIELLAKIRPQDHPEPPPADLIKRLRQVKEVRNNFAHYPVTFYPVGEPPNQILEPYLVTHAHNIKLDDQFILATGSLYQSVKQDLESFYKKIKKVTDPVLQFSQVDTNDSEG